MGLTVRVSTINVKNDDDERAIEFLDSGPFKQGLALFQTAQPALKPFTEIALGLGKMLLAGNRNRAVQQFDFGLDFDDGHALGARLREGNYVVIQAPTSQFTWGDWVYDTRQSRIRHEVETDDAPEFNYIVFRIKRHRETAGG